MIIPLTINNLGFVNAQEMAAEAKLAAIKLTMARAGTSSFTFTGHSLGK